MKSTYKYFLVALTILTVMSCSRKKDKFINKVWHGLTAKNNTLFNGKQALIQGEEELEASYNDDYWNILPVERLQIEEQTLLQGESKNANFERAEEKATKAIQKHSMYIDGEERNWKMDEAFIMLGKARYFDGRFIPAQEAFNYVLRRYPTSNSITEARVWKEKVNIRLDNNEQAITKLKEILEEAKEEELDDQDVAEAAAMLSQAYINLQQLDSAIAPIRLASETIKDTEKKARYAFIKGQLYNSLGQLDSANIAFDEVIAMNRNIPRRYLVNAYVEKARNFDLNTEDKTEFNELLARLETYYENKPYLDRIYLLMGDYYQKLDSTDLAVEYYNKSLRTNSSDQYLKSRNYLTLADINFDAANYETAGAYFDSTITNLDNTTREFRRIKKRRVNLDDVILYEGIASVNDSILNVASLSPEDQLSFYQTYTSELKATAVAQARLTEAPATSLGANEFYTKQRNPNGGIGGPRAAAGFYFYNPTTVAYGKQQFQKTWGDRKLEDNWRTGGSVFGNNDAAEEGIDLVDQIENDPQFDPQTYVDLIPTDQIVLDSLSTDRNFAYYQLGLIYKEKFKEYELASAKLEALLKNNPEDRLILPSKYNLYKIYEANDQPSEAERVKNDILTNHPESRYAAILINPESLLNNENSPEAVYATLYKKFENQEYAEVLEKVETYITQYTGDDIVPKFELLKAFAEGRYLGFESYKEGLNFVALNYPQSEEGKQAAKIYKQSIPQLEFKEFYKDGEEGKFKLVYTFDKNNSTQEDLTKTKETIDKAIEDLGYQKMYTSIDVYNPFQNFLVVHGLNSSLGAEGFGELLNDNKNYKINKDFFGISSENYTIVQIHKNLGAFKTWETE